MVLAARTRLARNLAAFPFPGRAADRDLRRAAQVVRRAALADTERLADLSPVAIARLSARDKAALVDARRISPELARGGANRWALLDESGALSVFVNEEDHVRIQAVAAGNAALDVLRAGEDVDGRLARRLPWAVDARWGYLTASLSNVGTGLRLSILAHLPALAFLRRLPETLRAASHLGISIRGAHGEHSSAAGDLYRVSNAVTFGLSPAHIAGRVRPVADYLIAAERGARREVVDGHAARAVDLARAAWTRIERADRLEAGVALDLLSHLRLAAAAGLTPLGGHAPAPDAALFAALVAELRTGAGLAAAPGGARAGRRPRCTTPSSVPQKYVQRCGISTETRRKVLKDRVPGPGCRGRLRRPGGAGSEKVRYNESTVLHNALGSRSQGGVNRPCGNDSPNAPAASYSSLRKKPAGWARTMSAPSTCCWGWSARTIPSPPASWTASASRWAASAPRSSARLPAATGAWARTCRTTRAPSASSTWPMTRRGN